MPSPVRGRRTGNSRDAPTVADPGGAARRRGFVIPEGPVNIMLRRGMRLAKIGIAVNALLAMIKLFTGVVGHSYALIADGIESTADIFSSLVVWSGPFRGR